MEPSCSLIPDQKWQWLVRRPYSRSRLEEVDEYSTYRKSTNREYTIRGPVKNTPSRSLGARLKDTASASRVTGVSPRDLINFRGAIKTGDAAYIHGGGELVGQTRPQAVPRRPGETKLGYMSGAKRRTKDRSERTRKESGINAFCCAVSTVVFAFGISTRGGRADGKGEKGARACRSSR